MQITGVSTAAEDHSAAAFTAVQAITCTDFHRFTEPELLSLAKNFEGVARLVFTAQVRIAGEIDTRKIAGDHGATSTGALLRDILTISPAEARGRVITAKATLPQPALSGGTIDPALPHLAAALAAGQIGAEQARITVSTMDKVPAGIDPDRLGDVEATLVENGIISEPKPFARFARSILEILDPDGDLDDRPDPDKVDLHIGTRNESTGMTPFRGHLDDEGVELLHQSIDGLSKPRVEPDGSKDRRLNPVRQGQALKEVLRMFLDHGDAPTHGGERPHVTITMRYDDLQQRIADAVLSYGGPISAAEARRIACDAQIIPAVLGSGSDVLDIGRSQRLITPPIRRAITLRDKGCCFPGCDRPPGWTDGHHVKHWLQHGETAYHNSCLLCRAHHTLIHKGDWTIIFATDGVPEFIPPTWIDPTQTPRRNTANHLATLLGR
jgi:hypothetical protein